MYFNFVSCAIHDHFNEYQRISNHNDDAKQLLQHNHSLDLTKKELDQILNGADNVNPHVSNLKNYLNSNDNDLLFQYVLKHKDDLENLGIYHNLRDLSVKKIKLEQEIDLLFFKTMATEIEHGMSTGTKLTDIDLKDLMPNYGFDEAKYVLIYGSSDSTSIFKNLDNLRTLIQTKEEKSKLMNDFIESAIKSSNKEDSVMINKNSDSVVGSFIEMLEVCKDTLFNDSDRASNNFKANLQDYQTKNLNNLISVEESSFTQKFLIQMMKFIEDFLKNSHVAITNS